MQKKQTGISMIESLYTEAEADANRFNLKCLATLCFMVVLSEVLNEVGIFKVPIIVMRISSISAILLLSIPLLIFFINDKLLKKDKKILDNKRFKYLIIISTYFGIGLICVSLSFHAVILLAVPPLIAAQYRNQKKMIIWIMVATLVLVPVSVYGSFFLGTTDRNFIKGMISDEEFAILSNRLALATSQRMLELFTHYVLPRLLSMVAIIFLVLGITKRNGVMLKTQARLNHKVRKEMENKNKMQSHMIDVLTTLIETRDVGTGEHVIRTKKYARLVAEALQQEEKYKDILTDELVETIENAAPLHDVGKIAVSDTILLKPGKLTPEEFDAMKVHTTKGRKVIQDIFKGMENDMFLHTAEDIAIFHHERWDGTGYPQGLKGEEIPLPARIMAVADVYDALVSVRVYKKSIPAEEALNIMMSESGTHFDPDIMKVVQSLKDKMIRASQLPLAEIEK